MEQREHLQDAARETFCRRSLLSECARVLAPLSTGCVCRGAHRDSRTSRWSEAQLRELLPHEPPPMKSLAAEYLARLRVPQELAGRLRRLGEYKGRQELFRRQAPEMMENLRRVAIIESTESSNRIEGIVAEHKRVRDIVEHKVEPANRSEAEIAGYRDALDTIHQNHAHIPFAERVVLQLHRDLLKYAGGDGGRWKIKGNQITETLPDGARRTRFATLAPHLTEDAMRETHARYDDLLKANVWEPLFLIPFNVLDFLCIHPFLDGNGRMARLLTVLAL